MWCLKREETRCAFVDCNMAGSVLSELPNEVDWLWTPNSRSRTKINKCIIEVNTIPAT